MILHRFANVLNNANSNNNVSNDGGEGVKLEEAEINITVDDFEIEATKSIAKREAGGEVLRGNRFKGGSVIKKRLSFLVSGF